MSFINSKSGHRRGESLMSLSRRSVATLSRVMVAGILMSIALGPTSASDSSGRMPENASVNKYGSGWLCDHGYREIEGECKGIEIPANAYGTKTSYGRGWECSRGYRVLENECIRIEVPPNGYLDASSRRPWKCNRGYRARNETCVAIDVPSNGYLSGSSYGTGWKCERGFEVVDDGCIALKLPENAHIDYSGNDWACNRPFRKKDNQCVLSTHY